MTAGTFDLAIFVPLEVTPEGYRAIRALAEWIKTGKEPPEMFDVKAFEDRHPIVRRILAAVSVDQVSHAEKVASRFEDAAKQIAAVLPDGEVLEELLDTVESLQRRAVAAVVAFHGVDDPHAAPALTDAPTAGQDAPSNVIPMGVPGRDHPITYVPPAPMPTVDPAQGGTAETAQPAQDAPTEPVGDSGPAGAVHAQDEAAALS